jgi:hypothetical protein
MGDMQDPERFVPMHILRLAIRQGTRATYGSGLSRYAALMSRRNQPRAIEITVRDADGTIERYRHWPSIGTAGAGS